MKRNYFTLAIACTFSLFLMLLTTGCGDSTVHSTGGEKTAPNFNSILDKVQSSGVLRVGYFLFEPAAMRANSGDKPHGLFVDMIEQLARDMKWKIEYKQVDLKNFAAALQAGDFDLSIGATFSSPSRAGGVAFTQPIYYLNPQVQ